MLDFQIIKNKLLNENKVEELLEAIGCNYISIEQRGFLTTAQLSDKFYSDNKRSVQVKMDEYMGCKIRTMSDFKGDIFSLVSYIHHDKRGEDIQSDLGDAKEFICNLFGWSEYTGRRKGYIVKKDYTACLKEIIGGRRRAKEITPNPVLPDSILNDFLPYPSYDWFEEGISYETQMHYSIMFDLETKRIVIPMRNRFGGLVGTKARIMHEEDDERKYLYLHRYNNSQELFNFHNAHPYIILEKKVYVFEGEKSCMLMYENKIYNCVAVGSSSISEVQAGLIKQCGLDIEIVMCFDKDKTVDEVRDVSRVFSGRNVYGIVDITNMLDDKMSPIDSGLEVFIELDNHNCYLIHASD